jgi:hypothetical protein
MMTHTRYLLKIVAVGTSLQLVHCGAKTGLREPCILPLSGTTPAFVLGYETSNATIVWEGNDAFSGPLPPYLEYISCSRAILPALQAHAAIGAIAGPVPTETMPGVYCPNPTSMSQPIMLNNADAIINEMVTTRTFSSRPGNAVTGLLHVAAQALRALPPQYDPRIIVFMNTGGASCLEPPNNLQTHIAPLVALTATGIRTMVISNRRPMSFSSQSNELAVAGGMPTGNVAEQFYGSDDPAPIRERLEKELFEPAYCRLRVEAASRGPDGWMLDGDEGFTAARDSTHRSGWDWSNPERTRIELFGETCRHIARRRVRPRLVSAVYSCATS